MTNEEAISKLEFLRAEVWNEDSDGYEYAVAIDMAIEALSAQPERECEKCIFKPFKQFQPERKKGEWIDKSGGIEGAWNYCSVCGEQAIDLYDFCPNCGADMRGEQNGND